MRDLLHGQSGCRGTRPDLCLPAVRTHRDRLALDRARETRLGRNAAAEERMRGVHTGIENGDRRAGSVVAALPGLVALYERHTAGEARLQERVFKHPDDVA